MTRTTMLIILVSTLTPLILVAAWALRILAWRARWDRETPAVGEQEPAPASTPAPPAPGWREALLHFARLHAWSLALGAVILGILLYLALVAPPRLNGEIPSLAAQPGRPYYWLRWLRSTLSAEYDFFWGLSSLTGILLTLGTLVWAGIRRSRPGVEAGILLAALTLAVHAQWAIGAKDSSAPWYYALAGVGILTWAVSARRRLAAALSLEPPPSRALEIFTLFALLILSAYARLVAFPAVPYGYEGDETKWTAEAVNLMLDGRPDNLGEYHRDAIPVSFYMQAPFHRIFGAGIFSARLEVIFFSVLGCLVFYWLLRQIAPYGLAALASYLLSISIFDISASRLANVESHVKFWPILALALLALALRTRKWQVFALSGLALAIGLLTYDTVWPVTAVFLLLAWLGIRKLDLPAAGRIRFWAALLFPVVLTLPLIFPYAVSRWQYYDLGSKGWQVDYWDTLRRGFTGIFESWFVATRPDFLYNRQGPLLNAILLPWLFLGFVAAWTLLRHRAASWNLVWVIFLVFPVPILTNQTVGRVYYPGLPAVYALTALGIYLAWKEFGSLLGHRRTLLAVLGLAALAWLPLFNLYIYFNETGDLADRLVRREIGDIVQQAGGKDKLFLYPIFADADEPLNNEYQVTELSLHAHLPPEKVPEGYHYVLYNDLLPSLGTYSDGRTLEILLDKVSPGQRQLRDQVAAALQRCYPQGKLTSYLYFDRYTLDTQALAQPACHPVLLNLEAIATPDGTFLKWSLSEDVSARVTVACDRGRPDTFWVEAEQYSLSDGWKVETAFAPGWSGAGFLMDLPGSRDTVYLSPLSTSRPVYVWVRSFRRTPENSMGGLSAGGQSFPFAQNSPLSSWEWERLGPVTLPAGAQEWHLTRPYSGPESEFMALFVDSLVFTADPAFDPRTDRVYEPLPGTIVDASSRASGQELAELEPGRYQCQAFASSGQSLVDPYGDEQVSSAPVYFEIAP